jgi:hypothetical protein
MLRPDSGVIDVTLEVPETREGRRISLASKTNARNEELGVNFGTISTLDEPLPSVLVEGGTIDVLVVVCVFCNIPLFLNVLEVLL